MTVKRQDTDNDELKFPFKIVLLHYMPSVYISLSFLIIKSIIECKEFLLIVCTWFSSSEKFNVSTNE